MKLAKETRTFGCLTLLALLALGGVWGWFAFTALPVVNIPSVALPKPNAFDIYAQAYAIQVARPDALYEKYKDGPPRSPQSLDERLPFYRKPELQKWLAQNAPALQTLRRGFAYQYREPVFPWAARRPHLTQSREMARILVAESYVRASRGDWNGAANGALDALRLGHDLPRGGTLIGTLVGYAIQALGRRPLQEFLPHLDAAASRAAARRLEKLHDSRVRHAETLTDEKWATQASLLQMMKKGGTQATALQLLGSGKSLQRFRLRSKRQLMRDYSAYMDTLIAAARLPYAKVATLPEPTDGFLALFAASYNRTRWNAARSETDDALLMLGFALRAYRLEHGAFPENLAQLTPDYVKAVPADPFGGGEALRYKKTGDKFLLWSIGPDKKDDAGRAIDNLPHYKQIEIPRRRWAMPDSKGDFVFGINH